MKDYTAKVFCSKCNKEYTVKSEFLSNLVNGGCPECNSQDIFYRDITLDGSTKEDTIVLGRGNKGRCG